MANPSVLPFGGKVAGEGYFPHCDTVAEANLAFLRAQHDCDITFLVGQGKREIKCHKSFLMSRSPVFKAMFSGRWDTLERKAVENAEPEAFQLFLEFIYGDRFPDSVPMAIPLLELGREYMVRPLVQKCEELLGHDTALRDADATLKTLNMADELKHIIFRAKENVEIGGRAVIYQGKLLYAWPYEWKPSLNKSLSQSLENASKVWLGAHLKESHIKEALVQDSVLSALYLCPSVWVAAETVGTDDISKQKLLIVSTFSYIIIQLDDLSDKYTSDSHRSKDIKSLGQIFLKIFGFLYPNRRSLREDSLYSDVANISLDVGIYVELLFEWAQELRKQFGVNKKTCRYLAQMIRCLFEGQGWCDESRAYLLDLNLQRYLRHYTSGFSAVQELIFLLEFEGVNVPGVVRENIYWKRCFELAGFLPSVVNDLFGLQREVRDAKRSGNRVDNVILLQMENKSSFDSALSYTLEQHDGALLEFRKILKFLDGCKDVLQELDEIQKDVFLKSIDIMGQYISGIVQTHVEMQRYKGIMEISFE